MAIALVGDGAMLMNGINGLVTIAKYWQEWSDPRLIILVLANHDLNQVTWEQRVMNGDPKFKPSRILLWGHRFLPRCSSASAPISA